MRGQGIAVAAFCFLLALAASASAECAWMLWVEHLRAQIASDVLTTSTHLN
jgi:hypothetical protein